ncbi:ribosome silencing factor [Acidiferrobacter sp.]|uniref:ribosome silencing factor n=1 Tax=Acidiferrobacter sp. TaxID=1872107 RepID=UPI0026186432|nr:ribosome silencing factor [Acidiferrobacter sp.]
MTKVERVREALEQAKAEDIAVLDVRSLTDVTDTMIIASGTSTRHVTSIGRKVDDSLREAGYKPQGVEGLGDGEWVLIDGGDVLVHVMHPKTRAFYALEKLWSEGFGAHEDAVRERRPRR